MCRGKMQDALVLYRLDHPFIGGQPADVGQSVLRQVAHACITVSGALAAVAKRRME